MQTYIDSVGFSLSFSSESPQNVIHIIQKLTGLLTAGLHRWSSASNKYVKLFFPSMKTGAYLYVSISRGC